MTTQRSKRLNPGEAFAMIHGAEALRRVREGKTGRLQLDGVARVKVLAEGPMFVQVQVVDGSWVTPGTTHEIPRHNVFQDAAEVEHFGRQIAWLFPSRKNPSAMRTPPGDRPDAGMLELAETNCAKAVR